MRKGKRKKNGKSQGLPWGGWESTINGGGQGWFFTWAVKNTGNEWTCVGGRESGESGNRGIRGG